MVKESHFRLSDKFCQQYEKIPPPFGFNGLGEFVYYRTYSRNNEHWSDTVRRVVEGCFELRKNILPLEDSKYRETEAQKMFDAMFHMRFMPPGRGLWAMGTDIIERKGLFGALFNCHFASTDPKMWKNDDPCRPYCFLMDMALLGGGVGFDTLGHDVPIRRPEGGVETIIIPDSREGWVQSFHALLVSYMKSTESLSQPIVLFDYSKIRLAGEKLKTYGGIASGPEPLRQLHEEVRKLLDERCNNELHVGTVGKRTIVDIMNMIGRCVISGNIRRSSEIAFGDYNDQEFLDLKNYEVNPDRASFGWCSNNSIYAKIGMNYEPIAQRIYANGEPGIFWIDTARHRGRLCDSPDERDAAIRGMNPCGEIPLESAECCNLAEVFFNLCGGNIAIFLDAVRCATIYSTTVAAAAKFQWEESQAVLERNRRIGVSVTGVAQFLAKNDMETLGKWLDCGYQHVREVNNIHANMFGIKSSVRLTCVKPSGTISLLAGVTPGIHHPESRFYIRRVRLAADSPLLEVLRKANYPIEPDVNSPTRTMVVEFAVDSGNGVKTIRDVSMRKQMELAAFLQNRWADNSVSCTVSFDSSIDNPQSIAETLSDFETSLKGISLLPRVSSGEKQPYPQMVYEEITESEYVQRRKKLLPCSFDPRQKIEHDERALPNDLMFCDGDRCILQRSDDTIV